MTTPTTGPQIGAPPSLEQVPVALLQVDPAYQRATDGPASRRLIAAMVARWDWKLYQPLAVARRADGGLFIIDGQHRHLAAVQRGDIMFLPCAMQSSLDLAGEADTFIKLNTERQRLTQADIFHGQLAAGNSHARRVLQLLEETGWKAARHSNTAAYTVNDLNCAPMLVLQVARGAEEAVHFALLTLRAAWPDKAVRSTATFLKALMVLHDAPPYTRSAAARAGLVARIARLLATCSQARWLVLADQLRERDPAFSQIKALAQQLIDADTGAGAASPDAAHPDVLLAVKPAEPAPVRPAATFVEPPRLNSRFNLEGGRAFCDQCQLRQTRDSVAVCKSQFCKLKGAI